MIKTVLLVEDDPSWQFNYEEILSDEGFKVMVAGSKEDAMKKFNDSVFDLAVIDLRLVDTDPKNNDGIEVIKELRQVFPEMPIIVKSGYLDPEIKNRLEELKIYDDNILDKLDEHGQKQKLVSILQRIFKD